MPFTFFAHQAPVLPLKRALPRRWSGTGLVLGSMAPDLGYFLLGAASTREWHRFRGVFLLCLPLSLALYWVITRLVAQPLARHLPRLGDFALEEYGLLAAQPRALSHWMTVAMSIVVGAGTHLAWDLFTHGGSWIGDYVPWLAHTVFTVGGHRVVGSSLLWVVSTVGGGLLTLRILRDIGRHRRLREWAERREPGSTARIDAGAPPATRSFWPIVVVFTVVGAIVAYLTRPPDFFWHDKATWVLVFLRTTALGFIGLCLASLLERRAWRTRRPAAARTSTAP